MHVDSMYSSTGNVKNNCHNGSSHGKDYIGEYGNFNCDAPWLLAKSAIHAMKVLNDEPSFILWTGDSTAHLKANEIKWETVYSNLANITDLLKLYFPSSIIIPVIGNHDSYPSNNFPSDNVKQMYQSYLSKGNFNLLIPPEATSTFLQGGYYERNVSPKLNVLVLNTNLYLTYNTNRSSENDPTGQFVWLRQRLKYAQQNGISVIIAAHVPPGYFERAALIPFMDDRFNDLYLHILLNYSNVILTQIYGHTHTDSFRLFSSPKGSLKTHAFIAPSVSPWSVPATGMKGINPSIRLYKYNEQQKMVFDYEQYFLNLTKANEKASKETDISLEETVATPSDDWHNDTDNDLVLPQPLQSNEKDAKKPTTSASIKWELAYRAAEFYGVKNLSVLSLSKIYKDLMTNKTTFERYYKMNTAGVQSEPCGETCFKMQTCAMMYLTSASLKKCFNSTNYSFQSTGLPSSGTTVSSVFDERFVSLRPVNKPHHPKHSVSPYASHMILGIALGLLISLIVVGIFFIRKRRFRSNFRYKRHYSVQA